MTLLASPRIEFERRYAAQALEAAVARGEPDILIRGPRGTGKTILICDFLYRLGLMFAGMTQIWVRKDRTDMDDSVIAAFEDEVLGIGHPLRMGPSRSSRTGYDLGNGTTIRLRGMKGSDSQKSISADVIWVCEGSELSEREYDEIGVTKRQRIGVTTFPYQCKLTDFNPMPLGHWTNQRCPTFPAHLYPRVPPGDGSDLPRVFTPAMYCEAQEFNLRPLDRTRHNSKLIVSFHADNPGYWDVDPWGWTSAGLKYCTDTLAPLGTNMRARYLEGRPVAVEGVVFEEFSRDKHVIEPFPNGWPAGWPVLVGYDPGYRHPCAVVFWGVAPTGQHYIVDEIHGSGWDIDKLGPAIKAKAAKYRVVAWLDDPRGANQKTQIGHGKTVRDYMREHFQIHFQPWQAAEGKGKQAQVEAVRAMLLRPKPLQVWENCVGVIGEFESWKYKTDAKGEDVAGDDAYEDRNNDAMDAICGIVADNPVYEIKPITSSGPVLNPFTNQPGGFAPHTTRGGKVRYYPEDEDD